MDDDAIMMLIVLLLVWVAMATLMMPIDLASLMIVVALVMVNGNGGQRLC